MNTIHEKMKEKMVINMGDALEWGELNPFRLVNVSHWLDGWHHPLFFVSFKFVAFVQSASTLKNL